MHSRWILFSSLATSLALGPMGAIAQRHTGNAVRHPASAAPSQAPTVVTPSSPTPDAANAPDVEARTHFDRGLTLFQAQDYNGALAEFQAAYDLSHRPTVLYNLGVAHQALHHYPEAARAIERYLRESNLTPERRAPVEQGLAEIRNFIAHVTLAGLPDGAAVTIDGEPAGISPFAGPVAVGTGRHVVAAHLDGYRDAQETLLIAGGQQREVRLTLHATAGPVAPTLGGTVTVHGAPVGAIIELDGQPARADTAVRVAAGVHALRVRTQGFPAFDGSVSVAVGANRTATLHLSTSHRMSIAPLAAFTGLTVASGVAMAVMGVVTQNTGAQFQALTQDDPRAASLSATGVTERTITNVLIGSTAALAVAAAVTGVFYVRAAGRASNSMDLVFAPRLQGGDAVVRVRF